MGGTYLFTNKNRLIHIKLYCLIIVDNNRMKDVIVKTLDDVETLSKGKARAAELARGKNAFIGLIELDQMAEVPIHRDSSEEYLYVCFTKFG